jgi:hypothetical protein
MGVAAEGAHVLLVVHRAVADLHRLETGNELVHLGIVAVAKL